KSIGVPPFSPGRMNVLWIGVAVVIVDDGGDATFLIYEGIKAAEVSFMRKRDGLKSDPQRYGEMKERVVGVSEETTTGL
ncbi:adenosylhomocysteinase-like, partial [Trifolium medium]|nr:adenosylhomocysteinase-like [Trifolium medium]